MSMSESLNRMILSQVLDSALDSANQRDVQGNTPLFYSIRSHRDTEVQLLLDAGADPFLMNNDGNNLLHVLASSLTNDERCYLFERFVHHGLNINARNLQGETPVFDFYYFHRGSNMA